jgi:hypothetical protein
MNYINFVILTNTPAQLRDFLIARNVIQQVETSEGTQLVGVLPGMEWVEVPNPVIRGDLTPDPRRCYLVKFAHESVAEQLEDTIEEGDTIYDWSKMGRWVKSNGSNVTAPAGWTIYGEPAGDAWKLDGLNVWLVRDNPERFGIWQ